MSDVSTVAVGDAPTVVVNEPKGKEGPKAPGYATSMLSKEQIQALSKELEDDPTVAERLPKGIPELFDAWRTLSRSTRVPAKDAPAEEWAAYRKAIGVPDAPDGYTLTKPQLPDGVRYDEGVEKWFREVMHRHGVPGDIVKSVFDDWNARNIGAAKGLLEATAKQKAEAQAAVQRYGREQLLKLQEAWGAKFSARLEAVKQTLNNPNVISQGLREKAIKAGLYQETDAGAFLDADFGQLIDLVARATRSDNRLGQTGEAGEEPVETNRQGRRVIKHKNPIKARKE